MTERSTFGRFPQGGAKPLVQGFARAASLLVGQRFLRICLSVRLVPAGFFEMVHETYPNIMGRLASN
jgi:hypothetical protein